MSSEKQVLLQQSLRLFNKAVEYDTRNQANEAIEFYSEGLITLSHLINLENDVDSKRKLLDKYTEYSNRVEQLKQIRGTPPVTQDYSFPTVPPLNNNQTREPDFLDVTVQGTINGINRLKEVDEKYQIHQQVGDKIVEGFVAVNEFDNKHQIHQKVGKAIEDGVNKAVEMDREYKIHEKIIDGAQTTFVKAKQINEEYKVTESIGNAIKTGYEKVVEMDEQHQIHQKIGSAITTGVRQLGELDEKYQIHQSIGNAVSTGLNSLYTFVANRTAPQNNNNNNN